ncbi:putative lactoylglutathione lyase [Litoreibacter ponti]|uniref:Bleomycin resistance protein n=1 Tax=Litoreibacter ponti TaxID=1510457 RepID=A0A2T6BN26_9RHOB|nr:VOC family protein [Litoreibacter ponti]PTX57397.1 putative lactoylglutathione lyase [Litoreibacter ponti]
MLISTCGILPVRDLDVTAEFYTKLGFKETGRWTGSGYLIMVMDTVEVHFAHNPENDPATSQCAIYIRTDDVDTLSAHIETLGIPAEGFPRFKPAEDKSWEMRELHLLDPDGNLLRIGQFM